MKLRLTASRYLSNVSGNLPNGFYGTFFQSLTRLPPAPTVNPALILAQGQLSPEDPALPLISAIKSEIQRVREQHKPNT